MPAILQLQVNVTKDGTTKASCFVLCCLVLVLVAPLQLAGDGTGVAAMADDAQGNHIQQKRKPMKDVPTLPSPYQAATPKDSLAAFHRNKSTFPIVATADA